MSIENIQLILGKASIDAEFRQLLLGDPQSALSSYLLTIKEKNSLMLIDGETLERMAYAFTISQSPKIRWEASHPKSQPELNKETIGTKQAQPASNIVSESLISPEKKTENS